MNERRETYHAIVAFSPNQKSGNHAGGKLIEKIETLHVTRKQIESDGVDRNSAGKDNKKGKGKKGKVGGNK